uniref:peptide methionine sulfoxide reductase MsrA 1 isoform X1 n=1 Tax=Oncorhynchus gorbuscha TaxID=8017 RepID=UPI001EAF8463|nr:peptide methionine sulfoxide reductase MsrA 1 isoform X1 [Oncorhynchus gorbuscha]
METVKVQKELCLLLSAKAQLLLAWRLLLIVSLAVADMADTTAMPTKDRALKGREEKMVVAEKHAVNGNPTVEPFPEGMETIMFGMGCFWGPEKRFWQKSGVFSTHVGYSGGHTPNPNYQEVCSGLTGHTEVVRVVFSPEDISLEELLKVFWESHDPTQGMKQQADYGTQYRSAIYASSPSQQELALNTRQAYQEVLSEKGYGSITTEVLEGQDFFYAEDYHQQYLKKVPKGYCCLKGTGVNCPIGAEADDDKDEL